MTGQTAKGIPYPTAGDPVANGDDAIKALADWLDANVGKVKSGSDTITPSAANTWTSKRVNFPGTPFNSIPEVIVSFNGTAAAPGTLSIYSSGADATGFTINVNRTTTGAVPFQWIAHNQ